MSEERRKMHRRGTIRLRHVWCLVSTLLLVIMERGIVRASAVIGDSKRPSLDTKGISRGIRVALSGGIAGGMSTFLLYPMDTAKTLRQADPVKYPKFTDALMDVFFENASSNQLNGGAVVNRGVLKLREAYRGVSTATFGAVSSSAVYFGAYELAKRNIGRLVINMVAKKRGDDRNPQAMSSAYLSAVPRIAVHSMSAATGNILSSLIFVPKEYIKQQLQAYGSGRILPSAISGSRVGARTHLGSPTVHLTAAQRAAYGIKKYQATPTTVALNAAQSATSTVSTVCTTAGCVIRETIQKKGVRGLYRGYQATLLRNIPTAILRFALYEEIKLHVFRATAQKREDAARASDQGGFSPVFFLSGALAGAIASGIMTPVDVLKTRMATGIIPSHLGTVGGMKYMLSQGGIGGVYVGAQARMLWSGAFSAVGFGTFELAKYCLGVGNVPPEAKKEKGEEEWDLNKTRRRQR